MLLCFHQLSRHLEKKLIQDTSPRFLVSPPCSKTTAKVHLKAIKKGLSYAQIPSPSINNTKTASESTTTIIEKYDSDDDQTIAPNPPTTTPATPSPTSSPTLLPTTNPNDNALPDDMFKQLIKPSNRTNYAYDNCKPITEKIYTNKSGPVLIPSSSGMNYVLVLYNFDSNLIWATTIPSKTKLQLVTA